MVSSAVSRISSLTPAETPGLAWRAGVMLPACCALGLPVRLADSGSLIVGVLERTGLRCRDQSSDPTPWPGDLGPSSQRWRPFPREVVARPLPGCHTCALTERVCASLPDTTGLRDSRPR